MASDKKNKLPDFKKPDAVRSKIMRSVKTKNTSAELLVRRALRSLGFHYRLHVKSLPGTPDISFKKLKKAIFVNGCFWHGHECKKGRLPKSNAEFWNEKIGKNRERDCRKTSDLQSLGWEVLIIWQCELDDFDNLIDALKDFLV